MNFINGIKPTGYYKPRRNNLDIVRTAYSHRRLKDYKSEQLKKYIKQKKEDLRPLPI